MSTLRALRAMLPRRLAGTAAAVIAVTALTGAAPASASDAAGGLPVLIGPEAIDLSLSGNPFASSARVPLLPRGERGPGPITPYVSAGVTDPSRDLDPTSPLSRRDMETSRASQRMDVGAGLNWNLTDRMQLFGEMGFQRSREQSYSLFGLDGNRDGTYVTGGFTIRVP